MPRPYGSPAHRVHDHPCAIIPAMDESMAQNLTPLLEAHLTPTHLALAHRIGDVAAEQGMVAYLVGGPVRDLLLGKPPVDVDFTVEGDVPSLASRLEEAHGAQVMMRSQFLTAKVRLEGTIVDLATARRERYPSSGALPRVEPGSIQEDLARRDFTINAMAVALAPGRFGELLDPFGGQEDLGQGRVQVLHGESFRDDATRILRGLRYEQRLGFHLEEETATLVRRDAQMLERISPDRLRHEIARIFQEPAPEQVLARAHELGVLQAVHPPLRWDTTLNEAASRLREQSRAEPLFTLALLAYPLKEAEAQGLVSRLNMPSEWERVILDIVRLPTTLPSLEDERLRPSQAFSLLKRYAPVVLEVALALEEHPARKRWLECYLTTLRHVRPELTGDDLLAMGIPQGPAIGQLLEALHRARLDGEVTSRDEEEAFVRQRVE